MAAFHSLVIDPSALANVLADSPNDVTVFDVRASTAFDEGHIEGAHSLEPSLLNRSLPPMGGLLPEPTVIATWAAAHGLSTDSQIVVYDAGMETAAARAVWVLNVFGFNQVYWLNGGVAAWQRTGGTITSAASATPQSREPQVLQADPNLVLTVPQVLESLHTPTPENPRRQAVDARSAAEFNGTDVRSQRGGHFPGAMHFDWRDLFADDGMLKSDAELRRAFSVRAVQEEEPILVYCQTHQRSAVTYIVLKHLGYPDVAALDGAWSAWGNDLSTPIVT